MMQLKKRLGAMLLVICMLFTLIPMSAMAAEKGTIVLTIGSTNFTVNGTSKTIDTQGTTAVIDDKGWTMLPLRAVVEAMGGTLEWNDSTRAITMKLGDQTVVMTIGSATAYVNNQATTMYTAPYITNSRTLVHVRALELFTGTTIAWNATTRQVTVTYTKPEEAQTITINLTNNSGTALQALYYSDSTFSTYSTNLLTSNVASGGTVSFKMTLDSKYTNYNLYTEAASTGVVTSYTGLNLANVKSYASVELRSDKTLNYALDSAVSVANVTLTFDNQSGVRIDELYMSTTNSTTAWNAAENLLPSSTVASGSTASVKISLGSSKTWYFRTVDRNGNIYTGSVDFTSTTLTKATLRQTTSSSKMFRLTVGGTSSGLTELTFANESGVRIDELYMSTKNSSSYWKEADNLMDSTLATGKTLKLEIELDSTKTWYFKAVDRDDEEYVGSVTFSSTDVEQATLTLRSAADDSYRLKETSSSSGSADLDVAIVNNTGNDIYAIFAVERNEGKNWADEIEDYGTRDLADVMDDFKKNLVLDDLENGEYVIAGDHFDADRYDLVVYFDSERIARYVYINTVDLREAEDTATIYLHGELSSGMSGEKWTTSDYDIVVDDSDIVLLYVENRSGGTISNLKLMDQASSGRVTKIIYADSITKNTGVYYLMHRADFTSKNLMFEYTYSGTTYTSDFDDVDDYYSFAVVTISSRDKDVDVEDISSLT